MNVETKKYIFSFNEISTSLRAHPHLDIFLVNPDNKSSSKFVCSDNFNGRKYNNFIKIKDREDLINFIIKEKYATIEEIVASEL
jgi:hypothetical protein